MRGRGREREDKILLRLARHGLQKQVHALCMLLHCSIVFKALAYMVGDYKFIISVFGQKPEQRVGGAGVAVHFVKAVCKISR